MCRLAVAALFHSPVTLKWILPLCLAAVAGGACPGADDFIMHAIKPPRPGADGNTVPSMVWLDDVDGDGRTDLIATHVAGFKPGHGFYCGEMTAGDMDGDGDLDFAYAGHGGGFLGWFENRGE